MNLLRRTDLETLIQDYEGQCVSMYMPTHSVGREVQQDPIRFKNLVDKAEEKLVNGGMRRPNVVELLKPARQLHDDQVFWQHQSSGLVVFLTQGMFRAYRLPLDLDTLLVIADRFHIKPLITLLNDEGYVYILALSQSGTHLFQATHYSMQELELTDVPGSLEEFRNRGHAKPHVQMHTQAQPSGGGGDRAGVFHGQGIDKDSAAELRQYFNQIDKAVTDALSGSRVPLVLAGLKELLPIYEQVNTYTYLMPQGIERNPETLSEKELWEKGWTIVAPRFQREKEEALSRYRYLRANKDLTTTELEDIVPAAYHGRIDTLLVAQDAHCWGIYESDMNKVTVQGDPNTENEDLLDFAAAHTLLKSGAVHMLEPDQMPDQAQAAAILRY